MWGGIIASVLKFLLGLIGKDAEASAKSEAEALKGRANSVESSYAEQEKARKESAAASENAAGGSSDDVFGSEKYND